MINVEKETKINKFDIELDVTEATFLMEAIKYALNDTAINEERKTSLERTLEKINDGFNNTLLLF